jgi:tRNA(Ile)-lysidine synthase
MYSVSSFLNDSYIIDDSSQVAALDYDSIKFPLELRHWKDGDRFQPLGMKHYKKLSDFMVDEKIPLNLKEEVLVLESHGEILWVVGHRIDDRYKITSKTKKIFQIEVTDNS